MNLRVFAVAFGPDLIRDDLIDLRLVELDRGAADGADRDVVQRAARGHADEWDRFRQAFAKKIRAEFFRDYAAFSRSRFEHRRDSLLADADARRIRQARHRFRETFALRRLVAVDRGDAEDQAELLEHEKGQFRAEGADRDQAAGKAGDRAGGGT